MSELEKAVAAIQEAMLQDPVIHDGMPFYLVIGPALETALEEMNTRASSTKGFLPFSQRLALANLFESWAEENKAAKTFGNMVAYLFINELLDVEAVKRIIDKKNGDEK